MDLIVDTDQYHRLWHRILCMSLYMMPSRSRSVPKSIEISIPRRVYDTHTKGDLKSCADRQNIMLY